MSGKATPVIEQYLSIKDQYSECLLFYRMGDFYELFFDDAIKVAKVLSIVLTHRGRYMGEPIPMCGVPAHSSKAYIHKLIKEGLKVAVCEQLETPEQAKKRGYKAVIKREVVQLITPGTVMDDELLEGDASNYILAISEFKGVVALAWLDISTGEFSYCLSHNLSAEFALIEPKELLVSESMFEGNAVLQKLTKEQEVFITKYVDSFFDYKKAERKLCDFYNISFVRNIGELSHAEISACGAILEYASQTQKKESIKLGYPKLYDHGYFVYIDPSARRSLEITANQSGEKVGSLLHAIDCTVTNGGARLLKSYLLSPISDVNLINKRLDVIESYVADHAFRNKIRDILKHCTDIDRALSRVTTGKANPKDLNMIKQGLEVALKLSAAMFKMKNISYNALDGHENLLEELDMALKEDRCTNSLKSGGVINPDFHPKLAQLDDIKNNSSTFIQELQSLYREQTGIATLKISSNNLIGYYVEVPARYNITSEEFIHKQSLASAVRFTTVKLQELEVKIINAHAHSIALELEIFNGLCQKVVDKFSEITLASQVIAKLDVISSLAEIAVTNDYVRPVVDNSTQFVIEGGWHPVVAQNMDDFVVNNTELNDETRVCLLTGPNMAGKSTFLRQNALIAILSHIGSFVPAKSARIGLIDKIFSRVGAGDNISKGQSTFMVEMIETASIVNQATHKSLVILDEVGRGTALYDGLAIAWAVIENIHNINKCRTIFATHYHELCNLEGALQMLSCYSMKVKDWAGEIIFLHEVAKGRSDKSYGLHVARLAGLPAVVIDRATKVLSSLKSDKV